MDDMYLSAAGRLKKFYEKHGTENVCAIDALGKPIGWKLFATGAMMASGGIMKEPPTDDFERAQLVLKFHRIKLQPVAEEFNTAKQNMLLQPKKTKMNPYPTPIMPPQIEHLKQLRKKVRELQLNVTRAQSVLDSHTPPPEPESTLEEDEKENLEEVEKIEI